MKLPLIYLFSLALCILIEAGNGNGLSLLIQHASQSLCCLNDYVFELSLRKPKFKTISRCKSSLDDYGPRQTQFN